ncbi:replication initiator protein A [Clostridium sp.]|uniref:replication initiator protein A n=1 Tax=Clostridium sp. TaxID=1506 RepID=UPI003F2AB120
MEEIAREFRYLYNCDLQRGGYITIPKEIYSEEAYKDLSNDAVLLYGILLDRFKLSRSNNYIDKYGRTYVVASLERISEILKVSRGKARRTIRELEAMKLLKIEKMGGYNSKRRMFLGEFFVDGDKEARHKKDTMDGTNIAPSKVQNLYPNKTYNNKTYNNKYVKKDIGVNSCYLEEFNFED